MRMVRFLAVSVAWLAVALVACGYATFALVVVQHYVPPSADPVFDQLELTLIAGRVEGVWNGNTSGVVEQLAPGWHLIHVGLFTRPRWRDIRGSLSAFEVQRNGNTGPHRSQCYFTVPLWPPLLCCLAVPACDWQIRRRRRKRAAVTRSGSVTADEANS